MRGSWPTGVVVLALAATCGNDDSGPVCGNGRVETPEECDDGRNGGHMDGCTAECRFSCHVATQWIDCMDGTDDCIEKLCVPGGYGQICETRNFAGQCMYFGCRSGVRDLGSCVDGVCTCAETDAEADAESDAGTSDGG